MDEKDIEGMRHKEADALLQRELRRLRRELIRNLLAPGLVLVVAAIGLILWLVYR